MTDKERARNRERRAGDDQVEDDVVIDEESETDLEELDDLLDEIDTVLEENAEEFVKNYVQKGGQ